MTAADVPEGERVLISAASWRSEARLLDELRRVLGSCPDVAFAHLADARVPEVQSVPEPALFVWLVPSALRSIRAALNLVSEAVASALPDGRFVDIVILNSAPELLEQLEAVGTLVAERDPEEHRHALAAIGDLAGYAPMAPRQRWWWPF